MNNMKGICQAIVLCGGSVPSTYSLRSIISHFSTRYTYAAVERAVRHGYVKRGPGKGTASTLTVTCAGRALAASTKGVYN